MVNVVILILVIVFAIILAGFFAGAETGIYQLSRLRLQLGTEKKRLSFVILGKCLRDSSALLISMLIGNNLSHYLATSVVTYVLLSKVEVAYTAELFATLITAPVLFVFAELIPKSIFYYRSDFLMPYIAPVLFAFHKIFSWCGAVPLFKNLSRILAQLAGSPIPSESMITAVRSSHIEAIFRQTREEGFLSSVQADIINRLAGMSSIRIRSVMTPVNKVQTVDADFDKSALLNKLRKCVFTRLPVTDRLSGDIVGFINIYDCLSSAQEFTDLRNFIKPARKIHANITVIDTINIMQSENQKIVLVVRAGHPGREKPIGLVTMKDLVEELLGELTEW